MEASKPNHTNGGSFIYDKAGNLVSHKKPTLHLSADEVQRRNKYQPIVDAIKRMDRADKSHFTKAGSPKVPAVEAVLGAQITEAERDIAWGIVVLEEGEKA